MSGGVVYVLDDTGDFAENRCNLEMVGLGPVDRPEDVAELKDLIERHVRYTGSTVGRRILDEWESFLPRFVTVMPVEYKRVLEEKARLGARYHVEPPVGELVGVDHG